MQNLVYRKIIESKFRTMQLTLVCCYAGRRINSRLFIPYQQQFRLRDFFSTFVRNLNFNKFNWAEGWAGRALNTSTAASPNVIHHYETFADDIPFNDFKSFRFRADGFREII
jgi:hypothetical protein